MGMSERKQKEKEIRRKDIIDAAERVFFTKGYLTSTMDDVAKEAEFSKRTVYVYFNSKEQIYFEIMVRGYKLLNARLEQELIHYSDSDSAYRLKVIGQTLFAFSNDYSKYFEAIVEYENGELDFTNGITNHAKEECYAQGEKLFGYVANAIQTGVEEGIFRNNLDIVGTSLILWSCTIGIFSVARKKSKYIKHYHQRNPEELITESYEYLIRSLKK